MVEEIWLERVLSVLSVSGRVVLPWVAGEKLAAQWWQKRGEETLMSEVSHVDECICLATIQGHTDYLHTAWGNKGICGAGFLLFPLCYSSRHFSSPSHIRVRRNSDLQPPKTWALSWHGFSLTCLACLLRGNALWVDHCDWLLYTLIQNSGNLSLQ